MENTKDTYWFLEGGNRFTNVDVIYGTLKEMNMPVETADFFAEGKERHTAEVPFKLIELIESGKISLPIKIAVWRRKGPDGLHERLRFFERILSKKAREMKKKIAELRKERQKPPHLRQKPQHLR